VHFLQEEDLVDSRQRDANTQQKASPQDEARLAKRNAAST
jgi:hypothetical protein